MYAYRFKQCIQRHTHIYTQTQRCSDTDIHIDTHRQTCMGTHKKVFINSLKEVNVKFEN